jgi:hypothetical protein
VAPALSLPLVQAETALPVLNFVYLYRSHPTGIGKQSRLTRLVSLWLDVKERELSDRARKPPQSN